MNLRIEALHIMMLERAHLLTMRLNWSALRTRSTDTCSWVRKDTQRAGLKSAGRLVKTRPWRRACSYWRSCINKHVPDRRWWGWRPRAPVPAGSPTAPGSGARTGAATGCFRSRSGSSTTYLLQMLNKLYSGPQFPIQSHYNIVDDEFHKTAVVLQISPALFVLNNSPPLELAPGPSLQILLFFISLPWISPCKQGRGGTAVKQRGTSGAANASASVITITYIIKMQIDFSSLSYKLPTPTLRPAKPSLEDTRTTYEEETSNPFRRTGHLFKHMGRAQGSSQQPGATARVQAPGEAGVYSIENFDSFNNNSWKSSGDTSQLPSLHSVLCRGSKDYIRIENEFCLQSESQELSSIAEERKYGIKYTGLKLFSPRRIKTEYLEHDHEQEQEAGKNMLDQSEGAENKKKEKIFFLTAQEDSSESNVQEFYFDLRKQQQSLAKTHEVGDRPARSKKEEIREIVYSLMQRIDCMAQDQVEDSLAPRLKALLHQLNPQGQATPLKQIENIDSFVAEKWVKPARTPSKNIKTMIMNKQASRQNKQNMVALEDRNKPDPVPKAKHPLTHRNNNSAYMAADSGRRKWMM